MLESNESIRRTRGNAEFGSEKIVVGMRAAIRHYRTSRLSRKDIAEFAGVTPPLVTYYFPDRDALLEAATLPVVKAFAEDMAQCLSRAIPPERVLWDAIETIIDFRARDGAVIDAYSKYREGRILQKSNPLAAIEGMVRTFFENFLKGSRNGTFYASLAQSSLLAMCDSLSKKHDGGEKFQCQLIYQTMICIIGEAMSSNSRASVIDRSGDTMAVADQQ